MLRKTKKKKQNETALKREWYVPVKVTLRYSGLPGILWYWLSRQVRQEDFEKYGGQCVSCPVRLKTWHDGDCGHLVASGAGGFATRFLRANLALQCKRCNNPSWCPDSPLFFALEVDRRWGSGTSAYLLGLRGVKQKEMKRAEYEEKIKALPSYQHAITM